MIWYRIRNVHIHIRQRATFLGMTCYECRKCGATSSKARWPLWKQGK